MQLIEESWRVAFRLLAENCEPGKMGNVMMKDIDNWATTKVSALNDHSSKLFHRMDQNN